MINIIKMDFSAQKHVFIWILPVAVLVAALYGNIAYIGTIMFLSVHLLISGVFASEQNNRIHLLHKNLPVTKAEIVGAKYVEVALVCILSAVFGLLLSLAAESIKRALGIDYFAINPAGFIITAVFSALGVMLLVSVNLLTIHKIGFSRVAVIQNIVWIFFAILFPSIIHRLSVIETIIPLGMFLLILTIITIIITIVSFKLSVKAYGKN